VTTPSDPLPSELAAAHAMILAQREQLTLAKSEVTVGRLEIERLKLMLAKARREQFGQSSERGNISKVSPSTPAAPWLDLTAL
jgi:transposase